MVWSKEALSSWLLSLEKPTLVTPLLWARSNLRRHWPVRIFHTWRWTDRQGQLYGTMTNWPTQRNRYIQDNKKQKETRQVIHAQ